MMRCEFNINGQCIHDTGIERVACGTCPYSFEEGACRCAMFAPHEPNSKLSYIEKRASWDDVAAKGRAIVATDGVEIIKDDAQEVDAWVMSGQLEGELNDLGRPIDITDGGPYDVILSKKSWQNRSNVGGWIQGWLCDCVWGDYYSGVPDGYGFHGRFCFEPDTMILMGDGTYKAISDIGVGDIVMAKDSPQKVITTYERDYDGEMVELSVSGSCFPIRMTPNHPILSNVELNAIESVHGHKGGGKKTKWHKALSDINKWGGFVDASDLEIGQLSLVTCNVGEAVVDFNLDDMFPNVIDKNGKAVWGRELPDCFSGGRVSTLNGCNHIIHMDDDLAYVAGWYLAEGSVEGHNEKEIIRWSLSASETDVAHNIASALGRMGCDNVRIQDYSYRGSIAVIVSCRPLAELLVHLCGKGSKNKRLSMEIMQAPVGWQKKFLEAYSDGDGCKKGNGRCIYTSSDIVARQIGLVIHRVYGVTASIHKNANNPGPSARAIGATAKDAGLVIYHIDYDCDYVQRRYAVDKSHTAHRISDLRNYHYAGKVYNIEVENEHMYAPENILVHNCSHAYALMLYKNMRARKDFMGASVIDRENFIKDACAGKNVGDVEDRGNYQIVRNGDKVAIRIKNANEEFRISIDGEYCSGFAYIEQDEDLDLFCDINVDCWGDNGEESVDTYTTIYSPTNMYDVAIELEQEIEAEYGGELGIDLDALEIELSGALKTAKVAKKGNKEMYRWYRYAQEASDDPIEREFEALMERLRDAQGQDTLVEELQDICNDPKDYALLCAGFGNGEFAENMFSTTDTTLPVKLLYPTQNEIGLGNSLDFMLTGKSNVSMYFDSPVTIVAPIITFDNRFIIDGHHRWSQLYMINPEAEITAINFDGPVTAGQVLRDMQGAIAATHGEVPQSFADVKNVYRMSEDEIAAHIYDTIVDSAVDDMWEYANLIELYPFNTDENGEVPFEHKLDAVVDYLTDNALKLKGNNAPYSGAADRKDMPQTDSESVNELEQGATDI